MATVHPMLKPFVPERDDPFDAVKAAHLLNRAGFGGTPEEIEKVQKMGPADAVDWLLDFPNAPAEEISQTDVPDLSFIQDYPKTFRELVSGMQNKTEQEKQELRLLYQRANRQAIEATIEWWMKRMATGPHPLQEKLAFLWHGHFTTSTRDERSAWLIWKQNELLRQQAAGNFRSFVQGISRDPAMLDYLNNQQNRKQSPNENYARELMELFTLGIGNYSETDIKEAARAFTGWGHNGDRYTFRSWEHDEDEKTFFGRRGNFNGDDVIDIILQHPQCARYIGSKVYGWFVEPEVEPAIEASLAAILRENDWELRPLLRTILTSRIFYQASTVGSQIKSPIQLVVGTVRMMGLQLPPTRMLNASLGQMGQVLYNPPNVKGWPGGRMWINTSTIFVRYNTAVWLAGGSVPFSAGGGFLDAVLQARTSQNFQLNSTGTTPEQLVDAWITRLIQRPIDSAKKQTLIDALGNRVDNEQNVRTMIQLIVSMPEYQLC